MVPCKVKPSSEQKYENILAFNVKILQTNVRDLYTNIWALRQITIFTVIKEHFPVVYSDKSVKSNITLLVGHLNS